MKRILLVLLPLFIYLQPVFADSYPKFDISGYKKWEYRGVKVDPDSNYFSGLTQLGGFSPTVTGTPWQERLSLKILTQISDKLTVSYDIAQEPEAPERYNVKLNYDNKHELTFGDFSAVFSGNEFASTTRVLNGMMLTSRDDGHEVVAVPSAKLKSEVQGLTVQKGNNSKGPYSLGRGSIIEGSETIQLNGAFLVRGKEYVIDYIDGTITFDRILDETDEWSYSYEYTNIADLFFPALSRKEFFGFQARVKTDPSTWGRPQVKPEDIYLKGYEVFPSLPEELAPADGEDIMAGEEAGRFRLKHYPVALFSEVLIFEGAILAKDKDYIIKYDTGLITLLLPHLPAEDNRLQVSYSYLKTERAQEILPGAGSRGPYALFNRDITAGSEQIFINDRPLTPLLDYSIDYKEGRLIFNFEVPRTAMIKADYVHVEKSAPPKMAAVGLDQKLTVGATYLRESSRSGQGAASANNFESFTAPDIIANNNTIYLARYPILPTEEGGSMIISIGGETLVEHVDYAIPSSEVDPLTGYAKVTPDAKLAYLNDRYDLTGGYFTGTIKLLRPLEATQEVSVGYTYRKSVVTRYTGTGNGGRGPYYIRGYRNIIPGTERVEVWDTGSLNISVYTRNSSFEMDAGDLGYSINYYRDMPYITFNKELGPQKSFSVYFQYVPPAAPTGSNIKRDITGFDAEYKLGDFLTFTGNFATSRVDNVTVSINTIEAAQFIPPAQTVTVTRHNTPAMIEGSEKVYVNNYLRNRDIDYIIDYSGGTISFFYITLSTADAVVVEYEYPDPGGIAKIGETVDLAYKYGVESNLGDLSMNYNERATGFDFSPMGGTAIGPGTGRRDLTVGYTPAFHELNMGFNYIENTAPIGGSREAFSRSFDRSYTVGANPFGWAGLRMGVRSLENRGDPLTAGRTLSAHSELNEYTGSLTPAGLALGPVSFAHRYDGRLSDSREFIGNTFSRNKYFHLNQSLGLAPRIKGEVDWQFNEPYTLSGYRTTGEALTGKSTARDLNYGLDIDLTHGPLRRWTAYAKMIEHEKINDFSTAEAYLLTRNLTYHTEMIPVDILFVSYDLNREEKPAVVVEGKNPTSQKGATVAKLSPFPNFSTAWEHAEDLVIHDTGRETSGQSNNCSANWNVFSFDSIKLDVSCSKYQRSETGPYGTFEAARTFTDSFSQGYNLVLAPLPALVITPGFSRTDYNFTSTAADPLEASAQTLGLIVDYIPESPFSAYLDYKLMTTAIPGIDPRRKTNLGVKGRYKVLDWGTVVLSQEEEFNQGEVQAGGTVPRIDYAKITRALNIEFTIPQENPILSAIVFSLAYKTVGYDNRLPGGDGDDLHAQMVTFDGTLNF